MNMSKAALPARYGYASEEDRKHPLFNEYSRYRSSCSINLVNSDDFKDWLRSKERQEVDNKLAKHPQFKDFQKWMRDNQGGARKCPAGNFPLNFKYWLNNGRW